MESVNIKSQVDTSNIQNLIHEVAPRDNISYDEHSNHGAPCAIEVQIAISPLSTHVQAVPLSVYEMHRFHKHARKLAIEQLAFEIVDTNDSDDEYEYATYYNCINNSWDGNS
jgi:hypothetical protein